jgi:excisionase family DNA binding protein
MSIGVSEVAKRLGVSQVRVRQLIHEGHLDAQKVAGSWIVEEAQLAGKVWLKAAGRPMSPKNALALAQELEGQKSPQLSAVERHRLQRHLRNLAVHVNPKGQLQAWLAGRAEGMEFVISPADIPEFREDNRIKLSGVSDPRSGLLPGNEVEAYVAKRDMPMIGKDWFLVAAGPGVQANVKLRAMNCLPGEVPAMFSAMDLAERSGPREQAAADSIIKDVLGGFRVPRG